ncbi:hypothetical protein ACSXD9_13050 [Clostridium perfringens]|nr:Uncharacterised protein [Clostridium perfringens]
MNGRIYSKNMNKIETFFYNLNNNENIKSLINQNALDNRELAYLTIILVGITFMVIKSSDRKKLKESFLSLLKSFFCRKIFGTTVILFIWTILICFLLKKVGIWNYGLIKNTLLWFISSGAFIVFKVITIDKYSVKKYFKNILLDSFKITIILDFIQSTYILNYWIELVIGIIVLFLGMAQAVTELSKEDDKEKILNVLNKIFITIGIVWLISIVSELINQPKSLIDFNNIFGFIDNIILTISMLIPAFILKIYASYEDLFTRLNFLNIDNDMKRYIKFKIIFYAKLNVVKIDFKYYINIAWLNDKKKINDAFKELKKSSIKG